MPSHLARILLIALLSSATLACRSTGASFLLFGGPSAPQQDLLDSVQVAQEECVGAREDFGAAFHLYQRLTAPQAVELEELSGDFEDALDACRERAQDLGLRIDAAQKESAALFQGWNEELAHFSGDTLRKKSAAMLQDTQARAQRVAGALEGVRKRMEPVVLKLSDYALFFHHNLNARAIATLEDTYKDFDAEFRALDRELEQALSESQTFLTAFAEPAPASEARADAAKK
ncbi:MAG: DUF2959 family protein [Planctomycetes bacterium]|nr:DUF2959 family protein [Planctomycetota bacterium]